MDKKQREFSMTRSNFGKRGWLLVIYGLLVFFVGTLAKDSYLNLASGILAGKYGWDQNYLIGMSSYFGWATVILMIFVGQLMHKVSPRKLAAIFGLVSAVAIMLFGTVNAIWQYAVLLGIITVLNVIWPQQVNNTIVANWFPRKKGLVMGWVTIGLPLGSGLGTLLFFTFSGKIGMENTYFAYGAFALVVVICGIFLLRDYPEECGCFPDNDASMTPEMAKEFLEKGKKEFMSSCWTAKRMLSIKETYLIGISNGMMLLFASGFMSCMVPRLLSLGYESSTAVMMMMFAAILACFGSVICGLIDQKVGPRKAILITHCICIVSCILNIIPSIVTVIISLAGIGMVLGGAANYLVSIVSSYWGRYHFGRAYKVLLPINQLVGSSGALLVTSIASAYNFNVSYAVVAFLAVIGILLILPVKDNKIQEYTEKFQAEDAAAVDAAK
jgi:sugar phosphate permease